MSNAKPIDMEYFKKELDKAYKQGFKDGKKAYITEKEVQRGLIDG